MSLILPTQTAASVPTPTSGYAHQFIDSADGLSKVKRSDGTYTGSPFLGVTVANRAARLALTNLGIGQMVKQTAPASTWLYLGGGESTPGNWQLVGAQMSALAADVTRTNTTTLTDAGLLLDLEVGAYAFEALLMTTTTAATNGSFAKYQFVTGATLSSANVVADGNYLSAVPSSLTPSTATWFSAVINSQALLTTAFQASNAATSAIAFTRLRGGLVVSAAGTLTLSFAQSTAVANVHALLAGSFLQVTRG